MTNPSVIHATAKVQKSYPQPVDQVFAAFSDPAKKRRWYAEREGGHDIVKFDMDFRPGGSGVLQYRLGANTPFPGAIITNQEEFQDIVPGKRIVASSVMSLGDHRFSASLVTVEFVESAKGTEVILTHQDAFFENSDGPELREKGWRDLLACLDAEMQR